MKMANIKIIKVYLLVYDYKNAIVKALACPEGNELTLCSKLNGLFYHILVIIFVVIHQVYI